MTILHTTPSLPRPFQHFLFGLMLSRFGDALYVFTLPWLAYSLSQSAAVMGLLYATEILPVLLLGAFTGAVLDQLDRRKVMLFTDLSRLVLVVSLPVSLWLGHLTLLHLFLVAFLLAVLTLAFETAAQTLTPDISGGHLTRANALQQTVAQFTLMLGPVLAGMLVATVGPSVTLTLNALSFLGTFLTVLPLKVSPFATQRITWQGTLKGIQEGFHFMRSHAIIRTLSLQATVGNFGFGMVSATLMYHLMTTLKLDATLSGINYALLGVGGFVGSVLIVPLSEHFEKRQLYPALLTVGMLGLLIVAFLPGNLTPGVGLALVGFCNVSWVVLSTTVRQEHIPTELMGRVLSFTRMLSTAAMPLGAVLGGHLMEHTTPALVFMLAALTKGVEVWISLNSAMKTLK